MIGTIRTMLRTLCLLLLVGVLSGMLTACSTGGAPDRSLVQKAIALQLRQTEQELSQQLYRSVESPQFKIDHVRIETRTPLSIEGLEAYQVQGTYDLIQEFSNRRVTQRQNPFAVYVQHQAEDKTWRLAQLQQGKEGQHWVTQLVQ